MPPLLVASPYAILCEKLPHTPPFICCLQEFSQYRGVRNSERLAIMEEGCPSAGCLMEDEGSGDSLWLSLPGELQREIWTFLPPVDIFRQPLVCHHWHDITLHDDIWKAVHNKCASNPYFFPPPPQKDAKGLIFFTARLEDQRNLSRPGRKRSKTTSLNQHGKMRTTIYPPCFTGSSGLLPRVAQ